jgi:hypothetical protein
MVNKLKEINGGREEVALPASHGFDLSAMFDQGAADRK